MRTIAILGLTTFLVGCDNPTNAPANATANPPVTSPAVTATTSLTIVVPPTVVRGTSPALSARAVAPDGTSSDVTHEVTWSSSNLLVFSVSDGKLYGIGVGNATVRARLGDAVATADISVVPRELVSLTLTADSASAPVGLSAHLTLTAHYNDGSDVDVTARTIWSSSDASIAAVDAGGSVRAIAPGTTAISATFDGLGAATTFLVTGPAIASVLVTAPSQSFDSTLSEQLGATAVFTDGTTLDLTGVATWSSSDATVASVSATGLVRGVSAGNVSITASYGAISGSLDLTLVPPALTGITLDAASGPFVSDAGPIAVGGCRTIHVYATYDDGSTELETTAVSWSSSNTAVLTVSSDPATLGQTCAQASGTADLTVSWHGYSQTLTLTVQ